jgi:hypothetical protein
MTLCRRLIREIIRGIGRRTVFLRRRSPGICSQENHTTVSMEKFEKTVKIT